MHWHTLRAKPPRAPRNLSRLDQHVELSYAGDVDSARAAAAEALRGRRFRVVSHDDESVSAESGYLRETGNLVFHTGLCVVIIGVAVGHLFGWRGDVILTEGDTFSSTLSSYDSFLPGAMTDPEKLPPFTIGLTVDERHLRGPGGRRPVRRAPELHGDVTTTEQPGGPSTQSEISPNHPVTLDGADVFLLGNGYAPVVTVRDASGAVLYQQATPFLAQDNVYTSVGAIKVRGRAADGAGVQRLLPPDRRADVCERPHLDLPGRPQPGAGPVGLGGRPVPRQPAAVGLHPRHDQPHPADQGRRDAVAHPPPARPDVPAARRPGVDHLRQGGPVRRALGPGRPGQGAHPGRRDRHDPRADGLPRWSGGGASSFGSARRDDPSRTLVTIGGLARTSDPGLGAVAGRAAHRAQQRTLGMPSAELVGYSNLALYSAMAVFTVSMLVFAAYLAALGPVAAERGSEAALAGAGRGGERLGADARGCSAAGRCGAGRSGCRRPIRRWESPRLGRARPATSRCTWPGSAPCCSSPRS